MLRLEVDLSDVRDHHRAAAGKEGPMTKKEQDSLRAAAAQLFKLSREMMVKVKPTRSQYKQIETIATMLLYLAITE
jgi:hypothetical protein